MQLYPLRAPNPGMQEFVFHFDASRQHDQFAHRRGLLHIDAVVDRDARLQVRDIDESRAQSLPNFSSSAVLCRAVRAGQVSRRTKMITTTTAMMSAISANAVGQEIRPESADLDIER